MFHMFFFLHEFLFTDFSWLLLADWYSSQWILGRLQLSLWFISWLPSGIHRYINNEVALHLLFVFLVSSCVQSIYCLTLCLALAGLEWENWPKDSFVWFDQSLATRFCLLFRSEQNSISYNCSVGFYVSTLAKSLATRFCLLFRYICSCMVHAGFLR